MSGAVPGVALLVFLTLAAGPPQAPVALANDPFDAAYNLNYGEALRIARLDAAARPEDPVAHRTVATVAWMQVLFTRGGITIDHYLGSTTSSDIKLSPPPPGLDAEFKDHLQRSIALAEAALERNPKDLAAQYNVGAAYGLSATYSATIEGKVRQAFSAARQAYGSHERILDQGPGRPEAGLVVGTYRYAVSGLSMPKRVMAHLVGFGGGRERGLSLVEGAVTSALTRTEARVALALMYSREGRHDDALRVLKALLAAYPQNRLLQLEVGSAAWRAGHAAEAESVLTAGLAWHDRDSRPKVAGERATWIYKRGMARVSLNHPDDALADLQLALSQKPVGWIRGRIHIELGKIADIRHQRAVALTEYLAATELCRTYHDPWCQEEAARLRKAPFTFRLVQ
ncbi:MAG: tetratricopeptide repeat protein [Vicinamibacterales bacterium]